jgi:hypothetical protein
LVPASAAWISEAGDEEARLALARTVVVVHEALDRSTRYRALQLRLADGEQRPPEAAFIDHPAPPHRVAVEPGGKHRGDNRRGAFR